MEKRQWKVLEAYGNMAYPKSAHIFNMAKGERVDNDETGEVGRHRTVRCFYEKLRNLDHPMRNVEPWRGFTSAGTTVRLAAVGPLQWPVEDQWWDQWWGRDWAAI